MATFHITKYFWNAGYWGFWPEFFTKSSSLHKVQLNFSSQPWGQWSRSVHKAKTELWNLQFKVNSERVEFHLQKRKGTKEFCTRKKLSSSSFLQFGIHRRLESCASVADLRGVSFLVWRKVLLVQIKGEANKHILSRKYAPLNSNYDITEICGIFHAYQNHIMIWIYRAIFFCLKYASLLPP